MVMFDLRERAPAPRTRRDQIARIRTRLAKIRPADQDMVDLLGVLKGIMDVVEDDGREDGE